MIKYLLTSTPCLRQGNIYERKLDPKADQSPIHDNPSHRDFQPRFEKFGTNKPGTLESFFYPVPVSRRYPSIRLTLTLLTHLTTQNLPTLNSKKIGVNENISVSTHYRLPLL